MAVKAIFALAALVAIAIALMLPVPGNHRTEARASQIETIAVGEG